MLLTASSAWADGLSLTWVSNYGPVTQTVKAGNSITPIVFDYEGIAGFSVTGLPTGLSYQNYTNHKKIYIVVLVVITQRVEHHLGGQQFRRERYAARRGGGRWLRAVLQRS